MGALVQTAWREVLQRKKPTLGPNVGAGREFLADAAEAGVHFMHSLCPLLPARLRPAVRDYVAQPSLLRRVAIGSPPKLQRRKAPALGSPIRFWRQLAHCVCAHLPTATGPPANMNTKRSNNFTTKTASRQGARKISRRRYLSTKPCGALLLPFSRFVGNRRSGRVYTILPDERKFQESPENELHSEAARPGPKPSSTRRQTQ